MFGCETRLKKNEKSKKRKEKNGQGDRKGTGGNEKK